jgi:hypothetical protein
MAGIEVDSTDAFLISLVDGNTSVDTILDVSGMPPEEAVERLRDLEQRRILGFVPARPRSKRPRR